MKTKTPSDQISDCYKRLKDKIHSLYRITIVSIGVG